MRGQVTVFVIVGLVILLGVGLFYISTDDEVPIVQNNEVITSYITSCLDTVVNEELNNLGTTGGLSLIDQTKFPHGTVGGDRILYGITKNRRSVGDLVPFAYEPSQYPDSGITLTNSNMYVADGLLEPLPLAMQDGYFGEVRLAGICDSQGPNAVGVGGCRIYPGNPLGTSREPSLQELLRKRIESRIGICADLTQFASIVGRQVEAASSPQAIVTFTEESVNIDLNYPIMAENQRLVPLIERRYSVRLLSLLQFAFEVAKQETRDINFDPSADYASLSSFRGGFKVTRSTVQPVAKFISSSKTESFFAPSVSAELLVFSDTQSKIDGEEFSFSYLVEHRGPVLGDYTTCDVGIGADPDDLPVTIAPDPYLVGGCMVTDSDGYSDYGLSP